MSKEVFLINKTSLDYNVLRNTTTLSIMSCLPKCGVNQFENEMHSQFSPLLHDFWAEVYIGKALYIHFKNTSLVDGQYVYEADQYRSEPPNENEGLCVSLLYFT